MAQSKLIGMDVEIPPKDEEELALEKLVFGDAEGFGDGLKNVDSIYDEDYDEGEDSDDSDEEDLEHIQDDQLFFVDDGEGEDKMDVDEDSEEESESEDEDTSDAWSDSEDENINVSLLDSNRTKKLRHAETDSVIGGKQYISRLRSQFEKIYPRPEWADSYEEDDVDEEGSDREAGVLTDDEDSQFESGDVRALANLLRQTSKYTNTKQSKLLPPIKLDILKLKDANQNHASRSAIQTLSFHPTHPLLLTSGYDRCVRVYHIDGKNNNVVSTIQFKDTPIQTAQFNPNAENNKIFAGGRRRYMYAWDLRTGSTEKISRMYGHESTQRSFENFKISPRGTFLALMGNSGWVNILSAVTTQYVQGFKIEGTLVDFDFAHDESFIIIANSIGEIWEFDMKTKKVIRKWNDETGVGITKVKLGGKNNKYVAVGSSSGIVNIYDRTKDIKSPLGTLDHLVTSISSLEFSHDGQMLVMASRAKVDSLRVVHLPSCKVFQNWPTSGTPLGKVTSVKFSPNSEMLCIANEAGKARLWRLNHY
ncbi:hypothetical protein WICPIJ_007526 [Wickerhamomyces pijperi]|uniref:Uncharacterized protein n=1 Tax=Wickerhamomyces pijperi TaxID=599730 RepID=A0A9P8Q021_WICPI|nr:hypothetical protein WICPIJ_007526 [Wickerhamomyces pijperi]